MLLKHLIYHHACIFICSLHLFVLIVLYPLYSGSMLYNRLAIPFPLDLPGHPRLRLWQWTNLSAETRLSHFASEPRLTQILRSYAVMSRMYARVYVKILQSVSIYIYTIIEYYRCVFNCEFILVSYTTTTVSWKFLNFRRESIGSSLADRNAPEKPRRMSDFRSSKAAKHLQPLATDFIPSCCPKFNASRKVK